jgi:hypothetical protein
MTPRLNDHKSPTLLSSIGGTDFRWTGNQIYVCSNAIYRMIRLSGCLNGPHNDLLIELAKWSGAAVQITLSDAVRHREGPPSSSKAEPEGTENSSPLLDE